MKGRWRGGRAFQVGAALVAVTLPSCGDGGVDADRASGASGKGASRSTAQVGSEGPGALGASPPVGQSDSTVTTGAHSDLEQARPPVTPPDPGKYAYDIRYDGAEPKRETREVALSIDGAREIQTPLAGFVEVMAFTQHGVLVTETKGGPKCVWDPPIKVMEAAPAQFRSEARCVLEQGDSTTETTRVDDVKLSLGENALRQDFTTTMRSQMVEDGRAPDPSLATTTTLSGYQIWDDPGGLADRGRIRIQWTGPGAPSDNTLEFVLVGRPPSAS